MSSTTASLTEWAQSNISKIFELSTDSSEKDNLQQLFETVFATNVQILMNHETISLDEFKGRISKTFATSNASVEWKEVMEVPAENGTDEKQVGIVAGFFVLTRSMTFRIRAAPAQNNTSVTVSAKIEHHESAQPDEHGDRRRIVNLILTSGTKAAPVHLHGRS
ncbi:hypothetical protein PQX77_001660 [Marasmius sp. AFHP31]|nr:hypothetical protein PQX77_001660 [Marasmius sp. AFHP31]